MVLKTKDKSGDVILPSPSSEKPPDNCLLCNKKIPEDFSKVPLFSEECTDMVY